MLEVWFLCCASRLNRIPFPLANIYKHHAIFLPTSPRKTANNMLDEPRQPHNGQASKKAFDGIHYASSRSDRCYLQRAQDEKI